jgi:hypothetical protein
LIRSHQFLGHLPGNNHKEFWPETKILEFSRQAGKYVSGGLAQMVGVAGQLGQKRQEASESFGGDFTTSSFASTQLASLRAIPWSQLDDQSLRRVALKIRLGRELVAAAALHPELAPPIAECTKGLLGAARRLEVLRALSLHDATQALDYLSTSDLYFILEAYLKSAPLEALGDSPVAQALARESKKAAAQPVQFFGGSHGTTYGCTHAHLLNLGPYEDYLNYRFATPMAERLAEFILILAESADRCGIPADGLAQIAEPAAHDLFSKLHLNSKDDWLTVIQNMNHFQLESLLPVLEKLQ